MKEFLRIEATDGQLTADSFQLQRIEKAVRPTTGKEEPVGVYWSKEASEKIAQFVALGNELFFHANASAEAETAKRAENDARKAAEAARLADKETAPSRPV